MLRSLVVVVLLAAPAVASPDDAVIGTWEGESKCTVADSPCHDEHVVYTITPDKTGLAMQADKVVDGKRLNMGTLPCHYDRTKKQLACTHEGAKPGDWLFTVSGDAMTGTLTLRTDHQLFRRVSVKRAAK